MLLLIFLLFSTALGSGIFDKIDNFKKELAEEYVSPDGLIREDLAAKLQETIDSYRASHSAVIGGIPDSDGDSVGKFKDFWERLKEEQETKVNDLKAELEEKRAAKETERAQKKEEFQQRWNEIKKKITGKVDEIKTKIKEEKEQTAAEVEARSLLPKDLTILEKQQLVQELFAVFEGIANATKMRKAEKKKERQETIEQMKPAIKEFFTNLKTKFAAWKAAKNEEKAQKWEDVKVILSSLIQTAIEKKKEKDAAVKEFWDKIYAKITWAGSSVTSGVPAPAETVVKATFLDRFTGTSIWQNVTWVMLSICVFLAVALLGTIIYQQRLKYERLPGDDGASQPIYPKLELHQDF